MRGRMPKQRALYTPALLLAVLGGAAGQSPSPASSSPSPYSPSPYSPSTSPSPSSSSSSSGSSSSSSSSSPSPSSVSSPVTKGAPASAPTSAGIAAPLAAPAPGGTVNNNNIGPCTVTFRQTLTANKPAPAGVGAQGVAVASDGSVALLSGSGPMGSQAANAYIFSFYNSVGQYNSCPQEIDDPAPLAGLSWGSAYAMSGDASTILVGAAGTVVSGALSGQGSDRSIDGKVYIYKLPELPGSTRGYVATSSSLQPSSSTHNPMFGSGGLAATEGAEFIYVGSPVASQPTSGLASLYGNASVFVYASNGQNGWSLSQTIPAPAGSNSTDFGRKVVATSIGDLLVVTDPLASAGPQTCGIYGASPGYITNGQVYVYKQSSSGSSAQYQLVQTLQGNISSVTGFGADVALAMDGSVLVVGAPEAGVGSRTVHVFTNENGVFVERATVTPPGNGTPLSRFGQQVALSGSGQLLVVHAPLPFVRAYDQPSNDQADTVYTYRLARSGGNGLSASLQGQLVCPNDQYGPTHTCQDFHQLAISQDGKLLLTSGAYAASSTSGASTYVYACQGCGGAGAGAAAPSA